MRIAILAVVAALTGTAAHAAFYQQSLLEGGVGGGFELSNFCDHGFYNCGPGTWVTPAYRFAPGDVIDFGQVTIGGSIFTPSSPFPFLVTTYIWTPQVLVGPFMSSAPIGPDSSCIVDCGYLVSPISPHPLNTFSLVYTAPADGYLQFEWVDSYNPFFGAGSHSFTYIPPVPEASTWAMLLLGFAGIGFVSYRRRLQPS